MSTEYIIDPEGTTVPKKRKQGSWVLAVVLPLALIPVALVGLLFVGIIAVVLCTAGLAYGITVLILVPRLRRKAMERVDSEVAPQSLESEFKTFSQRASLTLNITILLSLVAAGITALVDTDPSPYLPAVFIPLALIAVFASVAIGVNAPWLYGRTYLDGEAYALKMGTSAQGVIRASHWLGYVVWVGGVILAVIMLLGSAGVFG